MTLAEDLKNHKNKSQNNDGSVPAEYIASMAEAASQYYKKNERELLDKINEN